jgi:hypothetical protein
MLALRRAPAPQLNAVFCRRRGEMESIKRAAVVVATAVCTSTACLATQAGEPLPEVKTPLAWDLGCPPLAFGKVAVEAQMLGPLDERLLQCVDEEWMSCRDGQVQFKLKIGSRGQLRDIQLLSRGVPKVEACVTDWLRAQAFSAATDCQGMPLPSTSSGGVSWSPSGVRISLPGEGGVIPAVPSGCEAEFMRGRTTG